MVSNPANPSRAAADRFARLKALERPSTLPKNANQIEYVADVAQEISIAPSPRVPIASERLAALLGATIKQNGHGEHLSLHCWYGEHAPCTPEPSALHLLLPDAPEEVLDPEQWLFLDTETTGLSGGTGTYSFLVGLARWERGGLEVEQLFMREFSEERSLLAALAERIEERPVLVTFNGKSFDWPLLETRYRMTRALSTPTPRAHLDFLHPARNLWYCALAPYDCRNSNVTCWVGIAERRWLPISYRRSILISFVAGPQTRSSLCSFTTRWTCAGLAGLAERILALLGDENANSNDGLELFGLSRICERRGQVKRARKMYEQSIGSVLPRETARAARAALARLAKRDGDLSRARELWESMLGNSREGYEAYEQLAIYYEHQACDLPQALATTRNALAQLRRAHQLGLIAAASYHGAKSKFEHRLARLERKSGGTLLGALEL